MTSSEAAGRRSATGLRVLFASNTTFDLPLNPGLAAKWDALSREFELRVIARRGRVSADDPRFHLVPPIAPGLQGIALYGSLPLLAARELSRLHPHVVVAQSAFEAFAMLPVLSRRRSPPIITELHGDWRTAARFYGSRARRTYASLTDRAAEFALRRSDATRAVSSYTASLAEEVRGRAPDAVFPTYFDLDSFTREPLRPLPATPALAWVAVLERYKNPRLMAEAWRLAAPRVPGAKLVLVGRGSLQSIVDELVNEFPERVVAIPRLQPFEIANLLDESTALLLSSVSEGLPRVIMEAFARGRPVVATRAGGIPDIVEHERNGLLVPSDDAEALADAIVAVLTDRELAERLAAGARDPAAAMSATAEEFATSMRTLVERVAGRP